MRSLTGSSVSPGVARGRAFIYTAEILHPLPEDAPEPPQNDADQHERIRTAMTEVQHGLETDARQMSHALDDASGDIFLAQSAMMTDGMVAAKLDQHLNGGHVDAEVAVREVFATLAARFRTSEKSKLRLRGDDIEDLSRRLLLSLRGIHAHRLEGLPEGTVLVARHLFPSDTVFLSRLSTVAVIAEFAGPAAHAALLARELGIPCIGGIDRLMELIHAGDDIIVDGSRGIAFIEPDTSTVADYQKRITADAAARTGSVVMVPQQTVTNDGVTISVMANARSQEDVVCALRQGAEGIGLFRTEPFFLASKHLPTAEEFIVFLDRSLEPLAGLRVNVRLLDIGADKNPVYLPLPSEPDPFLGLRGVRVLLRYPDLLEAQLRALLDVSRRVNLGILLPMVTLQSDVVRVVEVCRKLATSMGVHELPPIGAMIETPAAALSMEQLAPHVDFFSIGTNDLTQYTLAAGRENPSVTEYFQDAHPAILRLISLTIAESGNIPVSLCGELAGRVAAIPDLLQTGLRSFSVASSLLHDVRRTISLSAAGTARGLPTATHAKAPDHPPGG